MFATLSCFGILYGAAGRLVREGGADHSGYAGLCEELNGILYYAIPAQVAKRRNANNFAEVDILDDGSAVITGYSLARSRDMKGRRSRLIPLFFLRWSVEIPRFVMIKYCKSVGQKLTVWCFGVQSGRMPAARGW